MTGTSLLVDVSEIEVSKGNVVFTCEGIGSCVGVCVYDSVAEIGGMVHVMLPKAIPGEVDLKAGMYVDTAIPALIELMVSKGADANRLVFAIAGGAQVLGGAGSESDWNVGALNATAIQKAIEDHSLRCLAQDLGGSEGRTISFCVSSGEIRIATIGGAEKLLCSAR